MRRILLITTLSLLCSCAQQATTSPFFDIEENGTLIVHTEKLNASMIAELSIPSEINGITVTDIGEQAFQGCEYLETIIIPDSVCEIDATAFWDCVSLLNVTLPSTSIEVTLPSADELQSLVGDTGFDTTTVVSDFVATLPTFEVLEGSSSFDVDVGGLISKTLEKVTP